MIRRTRLGSFRAKDYVDILAILDRFPLRIDDDANIQLLSRVFSAKRVPLELLGEIPKYRDFHRQGFTSVVDTVRDGVHLKSFDYYADEVERLAARILARKPR
jgi:hypothetical protein